MKFIDALFEEIDPEGGFKTPITRYQDFCQKRYKVEAGMDLGSDVGRFHALVWYIENYCAHRGVMQAPLSGAQIAFLCEAPSAASELYALPRILEHYWLNDLPRWGNVYRDPVRSLDLSFWWCNEKAPAMGVEKVLVPGRLIQALSAERCEEAAPVSEFIVRLALKEGHSWSLDTETERMACYIDLLFGERGLYNALFFPSRILARLERLGLSSDEREADGLASSNLTRAVRERAAAAADYRSRHLSVTLGHMNASASTLGEPWHRLSRHIAEVDSASALPRLVRVIGPIHSQSGLGQATRLSLEALKATGVTVQTLDFHLDNPATRAILWPDSVAETVEPAINLIHLNAESLPLAAAYLDPRLFENSYNIGYFFWELPQPPSCHALALRELDEVWVASAFNHAAYSGCSPIPVTHVSMAVEAIPSTTIDRAANRALFGIPADATAFMVTFDAFSFIKRKNPQGAILAFRQAFPKGDETVALVIKTHNLHALLGELSAAVLRDELKVLVSSDPRIVLVDRSLDHTDLIALKAACDCYVSLHRSEGWGFGALEAMQLGLPVIATHFSGNVDFCTAETSMNVPYQKAFLDPDDYIFVTPGDYWAEPDIGVAAEFMRDVVANPAAARLLGQQAKAHVETHFDKAAIGRRYLDRLREIASALAASSNQ